MRGGAIPLGLWAFLMALLLGNCWFWSHDGLDTACLAFTVFTIISWVAVLVARRPRVALRKGAPTQSDDPETLPTASMGAVMLAWGIASAVFGLEFGHFLVYFGIALVVVSLGVLARERYHERRLLARWQRGRAR